MSKENLPDIGIGGGALDRIWLASTGGTDTLAAGVICVRWRA